MGKPIEMTRREFSATDLRQLAAGTQDGAVVRRLLAIAPVLDGYPREEAARLIMPSVNAEAMNEHLKEISAQVTPGAHAVVVCDGAGWHQQGGRLKVPDNIALLPRSTVVRLSILALENGAVSGWHHRQGRNLAAPHT
jgi:hypothetical protein